MFKGIWAAQHGLEGQAIHAAQYGRAQHMSAPTEGNQYLDHNLLHA